MKKKKIKQKKLDTFLENNRQNTVSKLSELEQEIIDLYLSGLSCIKISNTLSISALTVRKILVKNNIKLRTVKAYHQQKHQKIIEFYKNGKTISEIAKATSYSEGTIINILKKYKLILSTRGKKILKLAKYVELQQKGYDFSDIAEKLSLTKKQLNKLLHNSGIKLTNLKYFNIPPLFSKIVEEFLKGIPLEELSFKYSLNLEEMKEIFEELGLYKNERLIDITFNESDQQKLVNTNLEESLTDGIPVIRKSTLKRYTSQDSINDVKLSPSSVNVFKAIESHGPLSQAEIVAMTGISRRTLRAILKNLLEKGLIKRKRSINDTRVFVYFV